MHTLKATASSSLSLAEGHYIYSIAPSSPGSFAAISSDDSLRVFDANGLSHASVVAASAHEGVTSLKSYDAGQQVLATAGRDGKVKLWDLRSGRKSAAVEMETRKPLVAPFRFDSPLFGAVSGGPHSRRGLTWGQRFPAVRLPKVCHAYA